MGLWNWLRRPAAPENAAPPAGPDPAEMLRTLAALDDRQWGRYAFRRESLEGKFTSAQKDAYIAAANRCGAEWARRLAAQYGSRDPWRLAQALGLKVHTPAMPTGGGQVLFAQFAEPDEITLFTDCLEQAARLGPVLPGRDELAAILLAHELFHAVELQNPAIYTRTETVELWRKPFSNRSRLLCLSEMAAMAFAKTLLDLSWSPYVLDVLLVYPYDPVAARSLWEEICEISKEE